MCVEGGGKCGRYCVWGRPHKPLACWEASSSSFSRRASGPPAKCPSTKGTTSMNLQGEVRGGGNTEYSPAWGGRT